MTNYARNNFVLIIDEIKYILKWINSQKKLTFRQKVGYGFGDLASCLFWTTIMTQLLFFYTDVFGLTAKAAGLMFFVSRILDAFF